MERSVVMYPQNYNPQEYVIVAIVPCNMWYVLGLQWMVAKACGELVHAHL